MADEFKPLVDPKAAAPDREPSEMDQEERHAALLRTHYECVRAMIDMEAESQYALELAGIDGEEIEKVGQQARDDDARQYEAQRGGPAGVIEDDPEELLE